MACVIKTLFGSFLWEIAASAASFQATICIDALTGIDACRPDKLIVQTIGSSNLNIFSKRYLSCLAGLAIRVQSVLACLLATCAWQFACLLAQEMLALGKETHDIYIGIQVDLLPETTRAPPCYCEGRSYPMDKRNAHPINKRNMSKRNNF